MQATWRIWRPSLSSFTKFKRQDHVEVSTSAAAALARSLKGVLSQRRPHDLGISFKTQALYVVVFVTRYLDLFLGSWVSFYNTVMKLFFIGSSVYILYLMRVKFK
jgi:ER lumen protein retaining receptor